MLNLNTEQYYDEQSVQIVLIRDKNGKCVKTPIFKKRILNSEAQRSYFHKINDWTSLYKPILEKEIKSWFLTRDGSYLITLYQSVEYSPEQAYQIRLMSWQLHLYSFHIENEPLTYHSLTNLIQLSDPKASVLVKEQEISTENEYFLKYFENTGTEIVMSLSDDYKSLIIRDNIDKTTHFISIPPGDSSSSGIVGIEDLFKCTDLKAQFKKNCINLQTEINSIIQVDQTVYFKANNEMYESLIKADWKDFERLEKSNVKEIWKFNSFSLIINEKGVQVYDVLSQSMANEVKGSNNTSLIKNNGICVYDQDENSYDNYHLAAFNYSFNGDSKIDIIQIKRIPKLQKDFFYEIQVIKTLTFNFSAFGKKETVAYLTCYSEPLICFILVVETQTYFQQWKISENQASLHDSQSCQPKFLGLQISEYLPFYPLNTREYINLARNPEKWANTDIIMPSTINIPSKNLFKEVSKLTNIQQVVRDGLQDSAFTSVPEINLMIYPYLFQSFHILNANTSSNDLQLNYRYNEIDLISSSTGRVLHLKFRQPLAFKHSRYLSDGRFFMFFINNSSDLLTIVVTRDLEVKTYTMEDPTTEYIYQLSQQDNRLYQFNSFMEHMRVYELDDIAGWQQVNETDVDSSNYKDFPARFSHSDNLDFDAFKKFQSFILSWVGKNEIYNQPGLKMTYFQDTHQIIYNSSQAWFLQNDNMRVQSIIRFKSLIKELIVSFGNLYMRYKENKVYQIRVGKDLPGYIPNNLFFQDRLITIYEEGTQDLQYYQSNSRIDPQEMIARLQFRTQFDPILEDNGFEEQKVDQILDLIKIKDFHYLASFSLLSRSNLLSQTQNFKYFQRICKAFGQKLDQVEASDLDTLLMHNISIQNEEYSSILDILIVKDEIDLTQQLINQMCKQDETGLLYQELNIYFSRIDTSKIELKPFLESQLGMMLISKDWYARYQRDDSRQMWSVNQPSIRKVLQEFWQIEESHKLNVNSEEGWNIEYGLINICDKLSSLAYTSYDVKAYEERLIIQTIKKMATRDQSILEIEAVKLIIEFKWEKYTRFFFAIQLLLYITFVAAFIVDVVSISKIGFNVHSKTQIVTRIICLVVNLLFGIYEMIDIFYNRSQYIAKFWNINDILNILLYIAFFVLSFADQKQEYALKSLQCLVVITSFIKVCYLIRIFTRLSFLVQMLMNVFYDLRFFLLFFAMVIGAMTVMVQIVLKSSGEGYDGIKNFAFYVLALRESIGDYDTSTLVGGSDPNFKVLLWLIWFVIIFVGNVVFMNFIIAVVSESYENCMERMIQSIQSAKLEMVEECENLMPDRYFQNPDLFPRFIIVRRPVQDEDGEGGTGDSEWQGFIKQMKRHFDKETMIIKTEFDKQKRAINEMRKSMEEQKRVNDGQQREIREKLDTIIKKMDGGNNHAKHK